MYLLSVALHYVLIEFETARQAERRESALELLARQAELEALKAQIQPHFLFNSLNSISSLVGTDPARAREMCASLADFLRQTLSVGEQKGIPLRDEIALAMKLFRQAAGTTSFSVDPYQIGFENEEGIESGAFWFYRKLGFRSTDPDLREATRAEETKLQTDPRRRTPARLLRRLARRNLLYDATGAKTEEWDRFHVRNLGLAANRRMAREFGGNPAAIRKSSVSRVGRRLGVDLRTWRAEARRAAESLALVVDLIEDLGRWTRDEKEAVVEILRAKSAREESGYLRRMQRHPRLRKAILKLGSSTKGQ